MKKNLLKTTSLILLVIMLFSNMAVFADSDNKDQNKSISLRYYKEYVKTGVITEIKDKTITLEDKSNKSMFKISDKTNLYNADNTKIKISDLKKNMEVEVVYNKVSNDKKDKVNNALSIKIVRNNTAIIESKILNLYTNNKKLYILVGDANDATKQILFTLADDAVIKNNANKEIEFSDLTKGLRIRVEHSNAMTKSLPAQCVAYSVEAIDNLDVEFIEEAIIEEINVKAKTITVSYDVKIGTKYYEQTLILTVDDETIILDKNNKAIALKNLKLGMIIDIKHEILPVLSSPPKAYAHKISVVYDNYEEPIYDEECEIYSMLIKLFLQTDKKAWINCVLNHDHNSRNLDNLDIEDFFKDLFEYYLED
jgi:hypothetical protein